MGRQSRRYICRLEDGDHNVPKAFNPIKKVSTKKGHRQKRKLPTPFFVYGYPEIRKPDYSLLRATTGSFLAALLEGMIPAISVRPMLISTRATAAPIGRIAWRLAIPVRA